MTWSRRSRVSRWLVYWVQMGLGWKAVDLAGSSARGVEQRGFLPPNMVFVVLCNSSEASLAVERGKFAGLFLHMIVDQIPPTESVKVRAG